MRYKKSKKDRPYPKFYLLYDHSYLVSCISVGNEQELGEVYKLRDLAKRECKHIDKPGECMELKATTFRVWKRYH